MKVLYWINCAIRPLTFEEARIALVIKLGNNYLNEDKLPDKERLLSVCADIITIQMENKTIILVYYTAQEYFKNQSDKHFLQAQADIISICLTYLSFNVFSRSPCISDRKLEKRLEEYPFFKYVVIY